DIPREIEKDVFRQVLLLAVSKLKQNDFDEAMLNKRIYVAFLNVLAETGLQFFDGADRLKLQLHVADFKGYHNADLKSALSDDGFESLPPQRFTALLMRQIGSPYYSVNALTLAYLCPTRKAMREIEKSYSSFEKEV